MEPWLDDITDDLQSLSFNSATTTTTDINCSISSSSSSSTTTGKPLPPPFGDQTQPPLSLSDLKFLHRLGAGDIGSVYLAELKSSMTDDGDGAVFAAKVMDKKEVASRTEREILEMVDHPFANGREGFQMVSNGLQGFRMGSVVL